MPYPDAYESALTGEVQRPEVAEFDLVEGMQALRNALQRKMPCD